MVSLAWLVKSQKKNEKKERVYKASMGFLKIVFKTFKPNFICSDFLKQNFDVWTKFNNLMNKV